MADDQGDKQTRGQGRGSKFFALAPDVLAKLWEVETTNRLNLVLTYLVLLAGTGIDHRLTKWSAKACEEYLGLGKPRAKHAIEELIAGGVVRRTDAATRMMPQYELPELPREVEPIFLPVQIVTGLGSETPILRRVRETGDDMLLRMLLDLYGLISLDATHGIPIENVRQGGRQNNEPTARKIAEVGAHAIWALQGGEWRSGSGDWASRHREKTQDPKLAWQPLWRRFDLLKQIGATYEEPWLFDSDALDAEPLMPLDPSGFYSLQSPSDEALLTRQAFDVCRALAGEERSYLFEKEAEYYVPLVLHRQTPALRRVTRLRVEADTPGRRLSWKRRCAIIEQTRQSLLQLEEDAEALRFNRPMRSAATR